MDDKMQVDDIKFDEDDIGQGTISDEPLSSEESKRLLRKIDMCLLPIMAISYMFQFLDKSGLSYSAILGLRSDLHLTGEDFSWASSIYYVGYLVASYPAGMLMVRWRVAKTISVTVLIWGTVLMLTALCSNSKHLLAVRFFLGATEAPIGPGLSVIISMWYRRSEQPLRHAGWFLGNHLAGVFGGLLAYGIGHIDTIAAWKAVFLIFGAATVAWSAGIFFFLPDEPMNARFLSKTERSKAILRVKENMTGVKNNKIKWDQCKEALLDIDCWMIVLIQLCNNIPNGGVASFGSIVVQGFGYDSFHTLLLQSAAYLCQIFLVIATTAGSTYFQNKRTYFMAFNLALSVTGAAMIGQVSREYKWTRYAGYVLVLSYISNFPLTMAMTSGNVAGFTKKMTANSMSFIAYCVGNLIGPQLFLANQAPTYTSGFLAMVVCFSIGVCLAFTLRFYLIWENRRRDRESTGQVMSVEEAETESYLSDKTDKQNRQFRYVY